ANGTFTYSPRPGGSDANDAFAYVVRDGHGGVAPGVALIRVTAPVASDQFPSTSVNTSLGVTLSKSVQPAGVGFVYTVQTVPPASQGTLLDANGHALSAGTRLPSSFVTFKPAQGFSGTTSFTYQPSSGTLNGNVATIH